MEQIAFSTLLRRLPQMRLGKGTLRWRENLGLRGLEALPIAFESAPFAVPAWARQDGHLSTVS